MADLGDVELVDVIKTRAPAALEAAYARHGGPVYALARGLCGDAAAEDLTVVVFLDLWNDPGAFRPAIGSLRSHLLMRTHRNGAQMLRDQAPDVDVRERPATLDQADAASLIDSLPEDERHALVLTYFGGHTCSEVARLLRTSQGTIRARVRDGLTRLQSLTPGP